MDIDNKFCSEKQVVVFAIYLLVITGIYLPISLLIQRYQKLEIREKILGNLAEYGVSWNEDEQRLFTEDFRELQYKLAQETNPERSNYETKVQDFIAQSEDINVLKVKPYLVLVNSKSVEHTRLWSYATAFWSVPVTVGYGRRIRFFVFDRQNHKLIGIIGIMRSDYRFRYSR